FISACNSSSGDSNAVDHTPSTPVVDEKTELEIRFNLPPKPDPKLNNATLRGIDIDHDKVRDDLEWIITSAAPDDNEQDAATRKAYYRWAQNWTEMIDVMEYDGGDRELLKSLYREKVMIIMSMIEGLVSRPERLETFETDLKNASEARYDLKDEINEILRGYRTGEFTIEELQNYLDSL
ncbi:MAG: hypothetical protein GY793_00475, partial [Proteobacteria bacterium]|nr:hypothetical protein [Pseudomonadota bacterium]